MEVEKELEFENRRLQTLTLLAKIGKNILDAAKIDKNRSKKDEAITNRAFLEVARNMAVVKEMTIGDANYGLMNTLIYACEKHPLLHAQSKHVLEV